MLKPTIGIAAAFAAALALIGVPSPSQAALPSDLPAADGGNGRVRVVHGVPNGAPVDIYVNGQIAAKNLAFTKISKYAPLPAGSYQVQVVPTGKTLAQGPVVISGTVPVEAGKDYTIAATGVVTAIKPVVYTDDNTPPVKGQSNIRVIHLSPDTPPVDVLVYTEPNYVNGTKVASNVAFQQASPYAAQKAGTYDISVNAAGTATPTLRMPLANIPSGHVITIFAFGFFNSQPLLKAGVSYDYTPNWGNVRVVHAVPDAGAVDVYVDGTRAVRGLKYTQVTKYLQLVPGSYRVQVVPTGKSLADGPVVIDSTADIKSGYYTLAAAGTASSLKTLAFSDAVPPYESGRGAVRVINLSPDSPPVDVTLPKNGNRKLALGLAFGQATDYIEANKGNYQISVVQTGSTTELAKSTVRVKDAQATTEFIMGLVNGKPKLQVYEVDDRKQK